MPTKTEYREYLQSEEWLARRREFLDDASTCEECELPRWLAVAVYDIDLHVVHRHFRTIGSEKFDDVFLLCRRCFEVKTQGETQLHRPQSWPCRTIDYDGEPCSEKQFRGPNQLCEVCLEYFVTRFLPSDHSDYRAWQSFLLEVSAWTIPHSWIGGPAWFWTIEDHDEGFGLEGDSAEFHYDWSILRAFALLLDRVSGTNRRRVFDQLVEFMAAVEKR